MIPLDTLRSRPRRSQLDAKLSSQTTTAIEGERCARANWIIRFGGTRSSRNAARSARPKSAIANLGRTGGRRYSKATVVYAGLLALLLSAFSEGYKYGSAYAAAGDGLPSIVGSVVPVFILPLPSWKRSGLDAHGDASGRQLNGGPRGLPRLGWEYIERSRNSKDRDRCHHVLRSRSGKYGRINRMGNGVKFVATYFEEHFKAIEELAARSEGFRDLCDDFAMAKCEKLRWEQSSAPERDERIAEYRDLIDGMWLEIEQELERAAIKTPWR